MTEFKTKLLMCSIRTVGAVAAVWILGGLIRYFEINYEDVKTVLGIANSWGPELTALALFSAVGYAFYRATIDETTDFEFVNFFRTGPGIKEDVGKLIYFLLGVAVMWTYFAFFWRKSLDVTYVVGTGTLFIVQGVAAIAGRAMGKPRDSDKVPDTPKEET